MPARTNDPSLALMRFGDRLRALREHKGLAQRQLAEQVGLSRSSVANMEAARQEPGIATLAALAAALEVTVDTLVTGAGAPTETPGRMTLHDLGVMLQAAAQQHHKLAEDAWETHRYHDAIRFRGIAEGLGLALNQHHAVTTGKPDVNHWSNWTTTTPGGCGMPAHL